jgi:hypothetical protein
VPSGIARLAIVMTWRYIWTVLAFFSEPVVILDIWENLSISDALPSPCRGGVQAFLIMSDPFISACQSHTDMRKLMLMYPIGVFVLWRMGTTYPEINWMCSRG